MTVNFFTNLNSKDNSVGDGTRWTRGFPVLEHADYVALARPFDCDEVK